MPARSPLAPPTAALAFAASELGLESNLSDDEDFLLSSEQEDDADEDDAGSPLPPANRLVHAKTFGTRELAEGIMPQEILRLNDFVTVVRFISRDIVWALDQGGTASRVHVSSSALEVTTSIRGVEDDDIRCDDWEPDARQSSFLSEGNDRVNQPRQVGSVQVRCPSGREYNKNHAQATRTLSRAFKVIIVPHAPIRAASPERRDEY